MPIIQIQALPQENPARVQQALSDTCAAVAKVYGCPPENVWATWQEIKPGMYLEGFKSADRQPAHTHPPIVELQCFEGRSAAQIEELLLTASRTLSQGLGIEGNIFMSYRHFRSGEVIAGDGVVRRS